MYAGGNRGEPTAESGMGCVGCGPVNCVHLLAVLLNRHINKISRAGEARTTPNNIGGSSRVPSCGLCDDPLTFEGICEVGTDIVELLLVGVCRGGLNDK